MAVLAIPTVWLVLAFFYETGSSGGAAEVAVEATLVASVLTIPYLLYVIGSLIRPQFFELPDARLRAGAVLVILLVLGFGALIGWQNDRFLTCGDFRVSGNDLPENCAPGEPVTQVLDE